MKKFYKAHKKECKIGGLVLLILFVILTIWLFIMPSFSNNKYGDRLKNIDQYKISSSTIDDIKAKLKENSKVIKVDYHIEGRILNFDITVENDTSTDDAKKCSDIVLDKISKKDQKYYDIQIVIDTKDNNKNYPIVGYKNKNSDKISYGNVGESSE